MGGVAASLVLRLFSVIGIPAVWQGLHAYRDGRARLAAGDYAGCASSMTSAIGSVPDSPKAWAYAGYCHLLDKEVKTGLEEWGTALSLEPDIQLDSRADELALLARVRAARAQPNVRSH